MAQQDRDPGAGFAALVWAYRFPIPCPILAFADLEKPAPPTILAWENRCFPPKFDSGGESSTMAENLERLKQRIPLLEYLQRHNWKPCRAGARQEFVGLCPLHQETHPSFYVNASKNLFYCHGCGQGGDLIRFVQLFLDLPFRQTVAHLEQELPPAPVFRLLEETAAFYQLQLHRHPEATDYLERRGVRDSSLIEELGIGYAPGGNLRRHLAARCSSFDQLLEIGLINHHGRDAFCRRLIFPCRQHGQIVNLYGRSIGAAFPHRLLPRSKGGLFAWESVSRFSTVILVEGLFDLAVLMTCCTSHVGERSARRCRKPLNPPCSIMPVTNWIKNPSLCRKP